MAPRMALSAESAAGSHNVCELEKSTGKSKKSRAPWLKLLTCLPRKISAGRKLVDKVQMLHPQWKLTKMAGDHRRKHLFIWRLGRLLDSFKKQRIWPEADDQNIIDRNLQGEPDKCEGHRVGSSINNPIMLDDKPDDSELPGKCELRGLGFGINYPIILDDEPDESDLPVGASSSILEESDESEFLVGQGSGISNPILIYDSDSDVQADEDDAEKCDFFAPFHVCLDESDESELPVGQGSGSSDPMTIDDYDPNVQENHDDAEECDYFAPFHVCPEESDKSEHPGWEFRAFVRKSR